MLTYRWVVFFFRYCRLVSVKARLEAQADRCRKLLAAGEAEEAAQLAAKVRDGKPKIRAYSFPAWKRLLEAPSRVAATGGDQQGYNMVAGKDADGRHVRILISDFQSGYDGFRLQISNLPWDDATPFTVKWSPLDGEHRRLDMVDQRQAQGREITIENPFQSPSVCLVEIDRSSAPLTAR